MQMYDLTQLYGKNEPPREEIMALYKSMDPDFADEYSGESLLHVAAKYADYEAAEYLLAAGAKAAVFNRYNETPLHLLAKGDTRTLKPESGAVYKTAVLLLDAKVSVLRKDNDGNACYHVAGESGNYEFVRALHEKGSKLTGTGKNGYTGMHYAAERVRHEISSLNYAKQDYERKKEKEKEKPSEPYEKQLSEYEKEYLEKKQVVENYFLTAKAFLDAGVDPTEKNEYGKTAPDFAVESGDKKMAALLSGMYSEDAGSEEQELIILSGSMTLHKAVEKKDYEAIRAILKLGADPNEVGGDGDHRTEGKTALAVAAENFDAEAVEILIEGGADPNFKDSEERAALSHFFTTDASVRTSLGVFQQKRPARILKSFVDAGFDINCIVNSKGETLLNLACRAGTGTGYNEFRLKSHVIDLVMEYAPNVDLPDLNGTTPLMNLCAADFDVIENQQIALLEAGADVGTIDKFGKTALIYAATNRSTTGAKQFAEYLFDAGDPMPDRADNDGKTALDHATENNNEPLVKFLLSKM
ncbi:MAG: ankyrin repeat domain-containing protein [Methanosarcinales archaeon]|jgi:ankyrin repeat protein|nr:ankyrin repeat domain-containing protein [Methanosarcinales archaeon]